MPWLLVGLEKEGEDGSDASDVAVDFCRHQPPERVAGASWG